MLVPLLLVGGGVAAILAFVLSDKDREVPDHPPDLPPPPPTEASKTTRWRGVNAILEELRKAALSSGIPLGLIVGWVARESAGKLAAKPQPGPGDTKMDERGYFQLTPEESKSLGVEHRRLSTDSTYSINAGLLLIGKYMRAVDALNVAPKGSPYYWMLVKLGHTMGSGGMRRVVDGARAAGQASSWQKLEDYALANASTYSKPSVKKWFPFVDSVREVGASFGFGDAPDTIVGGYPARPVAFDDIPDPLDVVQPAEGLIFA